MLGDGSARTGGTDTVGTGGGPVGSCMHGGSGVRGGALVTDTVRTGGMDIAGAGWRARPEGTALLAQHRA